MNNKYLIEEEISIEENFSKYLVRSLNDNKRYVLCILTNDFIYERTREYLLSKFKTIKNLNFDNVINIINIEIIYSMNGMKLDKPQYGYLMEHIEYKISAKTYLKECLPYEKLDIFMKLCGAINTLNMQGYIFDNIEIEDIILIKNNKNNIHVKIKNLLENEINKFNLLNRSINLPYQYNIETIEDGNKDNIGQIIELFNEIFTEKELRNQLKELNYIKKIYNQVNTINKSFKLIRFIEDVNDKMKTSYKLFDNKTLSTIKIDLDIIGMEEEIKIVEKSFQKILESKENYKVIAFNGKNGTGKTKFLEEIKYKLENKYFKDITYINNLINQKMNNEEKYNNLLNYIYKKIDKNLKDKYEIDIQEFISILVKEESINNENKKKLQLINTMSKLINEYTMTKSLVIIIDDLDQKSEFFKLFIRYIAFLKNNSENMMIIFSINKDKCDEEFLKFIDELKGLKQYEEYKISYFNQYNTTKMIKRMLNTNQNMNNLTIKIYSETLGNPQYINDVIRELYENKMLYFDKNIGKWKTSIKIKDILIPRALEKKLEAEISSLNQKEISILKKLSIFETPLSEKILLKYIIKESDSIEIYKKLKLKGFLSDKISDQGILIGFTNNLLRNILYLKLNKKNKIEMHFKASIFFEEVLFETDYYVEEFLIHLEKGENYEKAYFYTLKYAEVQDLFGNSIKSIYYYNKSLKYPFNSNGSKIAINIARIYEKKSDHQKSYEYFEKANLFAIQNNESEILIYTLLEMIIIKILDITDVDTGISYYLNCVRRLLDIKFYPNCEAYYYYALALKYRSEYDHKSALINAKKSITICQENKIKQYVFGWVTNILAEEYIKVGNYKEAKELCLSAIDIFIDNNNINGELSSKLLYASICNEERYCNEIILKKYQEIARLSNKYKVYKKEILSLINIGIIYIQEKKYAKAEEYLLAALERGREEDIDEYSFNICNKLCLLYIRSRRINSAIKYYYLTQNIQKNLKLSEEDIINSNYTYALYNLLICDYNEAYNYLKKIYPLISSTKNIHYKNMICNYYELMLYKCKNENEIKNVYNKLNDKIIKLKNTDIEIEIRINVIRRILLLGYKDFAKELFFNFKEYPNDYNLEGIYIFLEFNFRDKNHFNFLINKALRLCAIINNQEIKADIYTMVGKKYSELECNELALNYYYESIAIHIDMINLLKENDKLVYANNSRFLNTRSLFIECLSNNLNINMKFKNIDLLKRNEDVNELLNELGLSNILKNEAIFKSIQNLYEKCFYNDLNQIYKVLEMFSSDTIINIENIMKYMARITLSDKAMIITENKEGINEVICTYRITGKDEMNRYSSLNLDSKEDIFILYNSDPRFYQLNDKILKGGIKACIYMKIINKEKYINSSEGTNAKLILIANNSLNYINDDSKKKIEKFKPFLTFLLEKYNFTINSTLDKLTGVYNRKYFEESLLLLLDSARLEKNEFAVIMFDIDDFKGVNDKYGHQTGDETLVKLTKEVKKCIGKEDIIGRYGGEEFILLLPNTNKENAINIAEKIRINVENAKVLGDKRKVTISIGIAMSAYESLNNEEIIKRADQALYKAKYEGKNRYILWENDYGINSKTNNELTGVLSGDATKDYKLASILKEVANIVKYKSDKEEKIHEFILKIMQAIECETATLFIVKDKKIASTYSSNQKSKDGKDEVEKFNFKLIYKTIEIGTGRYLIDWDAVDNNNNYGIPNWRSICLTPIIWNGEILAIIYIYISVNKKEFTCNDYNLLNCFAEIGLPIFI